jgi:hypothetical protein
MQGIRESLGAGGAGRRPDPKEAIVQAIISDAKRRPLTVSAGTIRQRASRMGVKLGKLQLRRMLDEIVRRVDSDIIVYEKERRRSSMPRRLILVPKSLGTFEVPCEWVE